MLVVMNRVWAPSPSRGTYQLAVVLRFHWKHRSRMTSSHHEIDLLIVTFKIKYAAFGINHHRLLCRPATTAEEVTGTTLKVTPEMFALLTHRSASAPAFCELF